jgi:anti-sigma B factor antagonist
MEIDVKTVQGITVVALVGELTWKSAPEAQARILEDVEPGGKMLLDMSRVSYMSSAGLRLLLVVYRAVTGQGGKALLAGLSQELLETMSHTGFLDFFAHCDNVETGIGKLVS